LQQQYAAQRNREQSDFELTVYSPTITDRANMRSPPGEVQPNFMHFTKSVDDLPDKQGRESEANYRKYECARLETLLFIIVFDSFAFLDELVAMFVVLLIVEPAWLAC
jgi:hypothetical protein